MFQSWRRLAFLHWPVEASALASVLPPGIEPDEFDGSAWVGVTPFVVRGLRLRHTPALPWLSRFAETNVRTYVTYDGKPGIWFMSLDTPRRPAIVAARRGYRLPYERARIAIADRDDWVDYRLERADRRASLAVRYRPNGPVYEAAPGSFEQFACERYCLYTVDERLRLMRGDIDHPPWPLQPCEAEVRANTMAIPYGIELQGAPVAHYAGRQDVVIWRLDYA